MKSFLFRRALATSKFGRYERVEIGKRRLLRNERALFFLPVRRLLLSAQ